MRQIHVIVEDGSCRGRLASFLNEMDDTGKFERRDMICLMFQTIALSSKQKIDYFRTRMEARKEFKKLLLQFRVVTLTRVVAVEALKNGRFWIQIEGKVESICYWIAHGMEEKKINQKSKRTLRFLAQSVEKIQLPVFLLRQNKFGRRVGKSRSRFGMCSFLWRCLTDSQI